MNNEEKIADAQLKKINLEIKKLEEEKVNLKSESSQESRITKYLPLVVTTVIAIASLLWGIVSFISQQQAEQAQRQLEAELAGKESRNMVYQKQLDTYLEVAKIAGQISIEEEDAKIKDLFRQFSELFRGKLIVVQDKGVMNAVNQFENAYNDYRKNSKNKQVLLASAGNLVNACRQSLGERWDIPYIKKGD